MKDRHDSEYSLNSIQIGKRIRDARLVKHSHKAILRNYVIVRIHISVIIITVCCPGNFWQY